MLDTPLIPILHQFVEWLLIPTIGLLAALVAMAIWETGMLVGERVRGLQVLRDRGDIPLLEAYGRRRIERADILARVAPMLGLMGTLIPLGPGIAALSRGNFEMLAGAVSVAFDTTVVGLAVGVVGFIIGRFRRRWYDSLLSELESAQKVTEVSPMQTRDSQSIADADAEVRHVQV